MCLEHRGELDVASFALVEILLDRVRGIDDERDAGMFVADEVGRAPEIVVDELLEEHELDASTHYGYFS
jgi:hypothetical protein